MKRYNITLLLTLLLSSTTMAEPKTDTSRTDFQFCQERTFAVLHLYTKLEQGLPLSELPYMKLSKQYPTELKIVQEWWVVNMGDKMDLVIWHQDACMKVRQDSGKVMA